MNYDDELNKIEKDLQELFKNSFDLNRWANYQRPYMKELLKDNGNVLAILPTATGKSVLYQYFAWFKPEDGITLVVEPLQSIIDDQIAAFNKMEINGRNAMTAAKYLEDVNRIPDDVSIVYMNPELLFRYSNLIFELVKNGAVKLQMIVIDELHTMFEWGASFRSEFRYIPDFIYKVRSITKKLKTLFLTATLNKTEMDLCEAILNTKQQKDKIPVLKSGQKIEFRRIGKISDAHDPILKIIDGTERTENKEINDDSERKDNDLIEGIAFFKEKANISAFYRHLEKAVKGRTDFALEAKLDDHARDYEVYDSAESKWSYGRRRVRRLVDYTGDLNPDDKNYLLGLMNNKTYSICLYVLATKALAMGVDIQSINNVQIVGIPESWNCFIQEIGRVRTDPGTYRAFYCSSDAFKMLVNLIDSERKNPICRYDPFVNAMERLKAWDFLCLWEWYLDSLSSVKPKSAPAGIDVSLEELLKKRPAEIRNKLKDILKNDRTISLEDKEKYNFDQVFEPKFSISDLKPDRNKTSPLIAMNIAKEFISFDSDNPGIFNGGSAKIKKDGAARIFEAAKGSAPLNFIDFMTFNALYTYCNYQQNKAEADENDILQILLGQRCDNPKLLRYVKRSLEKIKSAEIGGYVKEQTMYEGRVKRELDPVKLYENGSFPIFIEYPELQCQIRVVETAKVRYLFDAITRGGEGMTAVNLIAVHYTLFGLKRKKQISGITAKKGRIQTVFALPFKPAAVDMALTEWLDLNSTAKKPNKRQDYQKLIWKMKKISVIEHDPEIGISDDDAIREAYADIVRKAEKKRSPKSKSRKELQKMGEERKKSWEKRCDNWNGKFDKNGKQIKSGKKEQWEDDKDTKLILFD